MKSATFLHEFRVSVCHCCSNNSQPVKVANLASSCRQEYSSIKIEEGGGLVQQ